MQYIPNLSIGIAGRARRGKGTIAGIMTQWCAAHEIPSQIVSFADPIKEFLISVVGRSEPFRGDDTQRNAPIPEVRWLDFAPEFRAAASELQGSHIDPASHPTGRQLMQLYGTNVIRKYFMADVWVRIAMNRSRNFPGVTLVDDVRFPNEAKMFDLVLKVDRPGFPMSDHASEVAVDQIPLDLFSCRFDNDGTIPDLAVKVHDWACSIPNFRVEV